MAAGAEPTKGRDAWTDAVETLNDHMGSQIFQEAGAMEGFDGILDAVEAASHDCIWSWLSGMGADLMVVPAENIEDLDLGSLGSPEGPENAT